MTTAESTPPAVSATALRFTPWATHQAWCPRCRWHMVGHEQQARTNQQDHNQKPGHRARLAVIPERGGQESMF